MLTFGDDRSSSLACAYVEQNFRLEVEIHRNMGYGCFTHYNSNVIRLQCTSVLGEYHTIAVNGNNTKHERKISSNISNLKLMIGWLIFFFLVCEIWYFQRLFKYQFYVKSANQRPGFRNSRYLLCYLLQISFSENEHFGFLSLNAHINISFSLSEKYDFAIKLRIEYKSEYKKGTFSNVLCFEMIEAVFVAFSIS